MTRATAPMLSQREQAAIAGAVLHRSRVYPRSEYWCDGPRFMAKLHCPTRDARAPQEDGERFDPQRPKAVASFARPETNVGRRVGRIQKPRADLSSTKRGEGGVKKLGPTVPESMTDSE